MSKCVLTIDDLKQYIADNIRRRREDVAKIYSSDEERERIEQELRALEIKAQMPQAISDYAKWYSTNNELIVLESILWRIKDLEHNLCLAKSHSCRAKSQSEK